MAGFDAFYLTVDPDETLLRGGLLLMAEMNCAACHEVPSDWQAKLPSLLGPHLETVGSRFNPDTIWRMVRSPQHRKSGTLMPGLFSGAPGDGEMAEAITLYLASLQQAAKPMPVGNQDRGRSLYHTVGCVACHQPATDYLPAGISGLTELEPPSITSSPLALADVWEPDALGRFLLNPLHDRPSARMPSLRLTEQEAADIAAYLQIGRMPESAPERAVLKITGQTIALGRRAFQEHRCANCHRTGEPMSARPALPLRALKPENTAGCLSSAVVPGIPRFDFSELQLRALRLALTHVQGQAPELEQAEQRIDWQMLRLNCYACHDRRHKGGPEEARAVYFGAGAQRFPPSLDGIGSRLSPSALRDVLHGLPGSRKLPDLTVRMPDFGKERTEPLIQDFLETK